MRKLGIYLLVIAWAGLIALSGCPAPDAKATMRFNLNLLDTVVGDEVPPSSVWRHPIDSSAVVWVSWGLDSVATRWRSLEDLRLKLPQGKYQIHIYPESVPEFSQYLYGEYWQVWYLDEANQVVLVYPKTTQFLILLDTTNTWDYNTGFVKQGWQYCYYNTGKPSDDWPHFEMDFYGGKKGVDSARYLVQMDTAYADIDTSFMQGETVVFQRKLKSGRIYPIHYIVKWVMQFKYIPIFSMGVESAIFAE
jgi:hypothetical protein